VCKLKKTSTLFKCDKIQRKEEEMRSKNNTKGELVKAILEAYQPIDLRYPMR